MKNANTYLKMPIPGWLGPGSLVYAPVPLSLDELPTFQDALTPMIFGKSQMIVDTK